MKKLAVIGIVLVGIALLPFVGNSVVKNAIKNRMDTLTSYGVVATLIKEKKSYLKTQLHYELIVDDEQKLLQYLNQFSSKQLPPYTKGLLDGVKIGVDMSYNNIPLNEKLAIDLYPLKFADTMMQDIEKNNPSLYQFLKRILQKRALQYHVDYSVVSGEFDGFMKDFDEKFSPEAGTDARLYFYKVTTAGKGMLLAPDILNANVDKFGVSMSSKTQQLDFEIQKASSSSNFASDTTYISSLQIEQAFLKTNADDTTTNIDASLRQLHADFSSDTQGKDADLFSKLTLEHLKVVQGKEVFALDGLHYDVAVQHLEKESYITIQKIFEKQSQQQSVEDTQKIQQSLLAIIAHGFDLKISDLTLNKVTTVKTGEIDGFELNLDLHVKEDSEFIAKYQQEPDRLMKNIQLHSTIELSKEFYALVNYLYPIDLIVAELKKESQNRVVFDIKMDDSHIIVNGKKVR